MFRKLCILLSLCGLAFVYVDAKIYECYNCQDCPVPFDASKVEKIKMDNCQYCTKGKMFSNKKSVQILRSCAPTCTESNEEVMGKSRESYCCQGDLCNSSNLPSTGSWAILFGASLTALMVGNRL